MNYLIRHYSYTDIRNKMILIYILNVTDIIFTLILCSTGFFMEANPVVAIVTSNTAASLLAKCVIPAILLIYLFIRMRSASEQQLKKANVVIVVLLAFYVLINLSHITWLSVYAIKPSIFS
jgi:hypothetical protein